MLPTTQANSQLQPVYAQAQNALQSQVPAIQQLYSALIQGLQAQNDAQVGNVLASAQARGVDRPMLAQDVQSQLGQELALQTGQLGAQQAQNTAAARMGIGQLGAQRANNVAELAQSLMANTQNSRKATLDAQAANRQYQLDSQRIRSDFAVQKTSYEKRQADAAAAAAARAAEKEARLTTGQALQTVGQLWQPGEDGYVNPKQWNELRKAFVAAGYSGSEFDSEFGSLVNPAHQRRDRRDLIRYQGVGLNG